MYATIDAMVGGESKQIKINFPNFTTQRQEDIIPVGNITYLSLDDTLVLQSIILTNQTLRNQGNIWYEGNIQCYDSNDNDVATFSFTDKKHLEELLVTVNGNFNWIINLNGDKMSTSFKFVCKDIKFRTNISPYIPLRKNNVQYELVFQNGNSDIFTIDRRQLTEVRVPTHNYFAMYNYYQNGRDVNQLKIRKKG
jgi:hypothetical protein